MTRTVYANGRNFSHKGSGDTSLSGPPDMCKTPVGSATPPLPYAVTSKASDLKDGSCTVSIDGNPTALASSHHSKCLGDQPGVAKGLVSGTVGKKTHFSSYSPDVIVEGEGVVRHLDATTMNTRNTLGTNMGKSDTAEIRTAEEEPLHLLRLNFVNTLGSPIPNVPYRVNKQGDSKDLDKPNGYSAEQGLTGIVSAVSDEKHDIYTCFETVTVPPEES